jgi:hypothetical protein
MHTRTSTVFLQLTQSVFSLLPVPPPPLLLLLLLLLFNPRVLPLTFAVLLQLTQEPPHLCHCC